MVSKILNRDSLSSSIASLGLPSSALFMTARRMSSRDDVTFTPSAVESPTAGSASIARTLEPGRSSVRTRTMAAASDVFPTRAIILACPSPINYPLSYLLKSNERLTIS